LVRAAGIPVTWPTINPMMPSGSDPFEMDTDEIERLVMEGNDAMVPANHDVDDPDGPRQAVSSLVFGFLKGRELRPDLFQPDLWAELTAGRMSRVTDQLERLVGDAQDPFQRAQVWELNFEPLAQDHGQALVAVSNPRNQDAPRFYLVLNRDPAVTAGNPWRIATVTVGAPGPGPDRT
jgi:hypothetical protein